MTNYGEAYNRILKKVEDGIFKKGNDCALRYAFDIVDISEYPMEERTPELCAWLMKYCMCKLSDVPMSSRTREFFISSFIDSSKDYIKNNPQEFDRQFFKDLIASNKYSTSFEDNCFEIMPLEYIDEEMCSLAMLISTDWTTEDWFLTVVRRKPEVLSKDLWDCAVQFYSQVADIISITPEEYKDEDYYLAACSPTFNVGFSLTQNKKNIIDRIPENILTEEFLVKLISSNPDNFFRFSETIYEKEIKLNKGGKEEIFKWWKVALIKDAKYIDSMQLNDERISYFISIYPEGTFEYDLYFKDLLKKYNEKTA